MLQVFRRKRSLNISQYTCNQCKLLAICQIPVCYIFFLVKHTAFTVFSWNIPEIKGVRVGILDELLNITATAPRLPGEWKSFLGRFVIFRPLQPNVMKSVNVLCTA